jgi:hypothetical protein
MSSVFASRRQGAPSGISDALLAVSRGHWGSLLRHLSGYQTRKIRLLCEGQLGFGTAKAVIASGAVTVHASTRLTLLQESAARALPMSRPF